MVDRIKVYEEKRKTRPIWIWLLPLVLLLAAITYFVLQNRHSTTSAATPATQSNPGIMTAGPAMTAATAFPDLGTVHFDTDKATLTSEGTSTLEQAAAAMKANPNVHLRLEGYTDSTGGDSHNVTLSQQRAATVAHFLKQQGIADNRLTGEGFGPAKPADTNATATGKADNRRVELFSQQ